MKKGSNTFKVRTSGARETMRWGTALAEFLKSGDIVCLFGDLGSGKTTFMKGVAEGRGVPASRVNSPTFVLMNVYEAKVPLVHFDFYRLENAGEIPAIGYEEFMYGEGITVIEWADRMDGLLPEERLDVLFAHAGEDRRTLCFRAEGRPYDAAVKGLRACGPAVRGPNAGKGRRT